MNPSSIFQAALGTAGNALAPGMSSLFQLGSSLFGQSSPKQAYTSTLQSAPSTTPTPSTGANPAATSPKTNYINSQTGATGSTAPAPSTTSTSPQVNPNYAYQGLGATPPGNIDQSSPQYQYQKAFDSYLQSLQPTDAETGAEKALSAQQLQSQKDQQYALDKPGQTLGFAAGEAGRVAKNNAFQTDALSNSLNALTGARTARTNATKARLDYQQGLYNDSLAAQKPSYTTVSPGATLFDNKTGKSVFTAPSLASQKGATAGNSATLKTDALTSANQLLSAFDNSSGVPFLGAKGAVGGSSILPSIPGTQNADFVANLDNLKSLLSLDNVKYLKGQGAVSDAERKLLADSATQLNRSQSEEQFRATLVKIIDSLNKFENSGGTDTSGTSDTLSVEAGGQTYTFPDQASLDAFKKEAGIQ